MPRWPAGLHPFAQSGRGGPGQQAVKPIVPPSIFAYGRKITQVPLQPGQAQTLLTATFQPVNVVSATTGTNSGAGPLTLTITIPATTQGNTIIVKASCSSTLTNGNIGSVTLGGVAANFHQVDSLTGIQGNLACWEDFNCAGGQTSVAITTTGGTGTLVLNACAYEVSGLVNTGAFDQTANSGNAGPSVGFSSTTTATLAQAAEIAFGMVTINAADAFTGPASPWVNQAQINGASSNRSLTGYDIVSSNAGLAYAGSISASVAYNAQITTFKAASTGATGQVTLGPVGVGTVWYPAQVTVSTTSGPTDSSTFNLYLGPAGVPITLVGTLFPGGAGTLALAIPPMSPGQYLIGVWTGGHPGDIASMNVIGVMDAATI